MKLKIYQIDAFASEVFKGNPAAVIPLEKWLSDEVMQKIAEENNLAETAFFVKKDELFEIRWFTPKLEVDLCGHATLASAHVIINYLNNNSKTLRFSSKSSELNVRKEKDGLVLNFPAKSFNIAKLPDGLFEGLGALPIELYKNDDYMMILDSEKEVRDINPDFNLLNKVDTRGIIVTAKGDKVDFISRFFAPRVGINEDPVTGSAHTMLIPYWSKRLHKKEMSAQQISARGGHLHCVDLGERVEIKGTAVTYLVGEIKI
ncbi:MAG: PhzF family phenazine biosynthesis protein [Cytophagales bacterium]